MSRYTAPSSTRHDLLAELRTAVADLSQARLIIELQQKEIRMLRVEVGKVRNPPLPLDTPA
jgi:hypothetical protein